MVGSWNTECVSQSSKQNFHRGGIRIKPNKEEKQQMRVTSPITRETLQELACVVLVLIPEEALLSYLNLLSQRDYLLQSVLITTKCFQLLYTELELENQNSARSLWFGWKKKKERNTHTHTPIHTNAFSKLNCHLPLFSWIRKYKKVVFLNNTKDPCICKNILHGNASGFRGDFKKWPNILFRKGLHLPMITMVKNN